MFDVIEQNKNSTFHVWDRGTYRVLVGKPEGKDPLGIPGRRWHNNIKMDLKEIGWDGADWIYPAGDMDWWSCEQGTETLGAIKWGRVCWLAEVLASQEGLYSVELVS